MEVVEWLDHSRKNVEKFRRRGLVGDLGAIGGNGCVPIRLLLIEEDVVLGPGAGEDLEIALRRVRRRMLAGHWQLRDAVDAHVGDRGDIVEEPVISRATAADKEHVPVGGLECGLAAINAGVLTLGRIARYTSRGGHLERL